MFFVLFQLLENLTFVCVKKICYLFFDKVENNSIKFLCFNELEFIYFLLKQIFCTAEVDQFPGMIYPITMKCAFLRTELWNLTAFSLTFIQKFCCALAEQLLQLPLLPRHVGHLLAVLQRLHCDGMLRPLCFTPSYQGIIHGELDPTRNVIFNCFSLFYP